MAERTMTIYRLTFREKGNKGGRTYAPTNLDGQNLLSIFKDWCVSIQGELMSVQNSDKLMKVEGLDSSFRNAVIASVRCGRTGEVEEVYDSESGKKTYTIQENEAALGLTRAVLEVPPRGESAFFFCEYCGRSNGAATLLRSFESYFRKHLGDVYLHKTPVLEGEAWIEAVKALKKVEVQVFTKANDSADGLDEQDFYFTVGKYAKRNKVLGGKELVTKVLRNPDFANSVVGLTSLEAFGGNAATRVKLNVVGRDGRTKEYRVGDENSGVAIREVLNSNGERVLSSEDLLGKCTESIARIAERLKVEWNVGWFTREA